MKLRLAKWLLLLALFAFFEGRNAYGASSKPKESLPLRSITIQGNLAVSEVEILKVLNLKIGKPAEQDKLGQAFDRVRLTYIHRGYLEARVSTDVVKTPLEITVSLRITEGTLFRLGELTIQGNQEISKDLIRREFKIKPGDPFDRSKVLEGQKRLYTAGCFDAVDLVFSTAPASRIDVTMKIRERRQQFFKGGAGYGTETKERLTVGFEDQNFFGGARRADLKYTWSGFSTQPDRNETQLLEATLTQPYFLKTQMLGQYAMERARKFREAYDSIENEIRANLEHRFTSSFSVKGTYRWQGTTLTRVSPEADTPAETSVDAIGATLRYDNTDDPFLPRRGWRTFGLLEEGLRLLKNDIGFHKMEARAGRFDTNEPGWTFFEGIQFGYLLPRAGDEVDVIPINERFFLGGANSVRGYSERSLGPKDAAGNPLGGTVFLVTNFEARHRIHRKIFGVVFFDMGQLYDYDPADDESHIDLDEFDDLAQGCGLGIRLHSPVGAIRLEAGYQLNPTGSTRFEDRTALHFSIGEVF